MIEKFFRIQAKESPFDVFARTHRVRREIKDAERKALKFRLEAEEFGGSDRHSVRWSQEAKLDELKEKKSKGFRLKREIILLNHILLPIPALDLDKLAAQRKQERIANRALLNAFNEADSISQTYPDGQMPLDAARAYAWDQDVMKGSTVTSFEQEARLDDMSRTFVLGELPQSQE